MKIIEELRQKIVFEASEKGLQLLSTNKSKDNLEFLQFFESRIEEEFNLQNLTFEQLKCFILVMDTIKKNYVYNDH